MKVTYMKISETDGFSEGLVIKPETEFEKEYIKRHDFPKMYDGNIVITDRPLSSKDGINKDKEDTQP